MGRMSYIRRPTHSELVDCNSHLSLSRSFQSTLHLTKNISNPTNPFQFQSDQMETLTSSITIVASPSAFSPLHKPPSRRTLRFSLPPKGNGSSSNDPDQIKLDAGDAKLVPVFNNPTLSQDAAMGLVLSAASVRGWTTGSGMEGPPVPAGVEGGLGTEKVSTFPWSLFTKSPRRRMRVAFTCNVCGQRTTRAINPHAYTDGTVFVQCCGCNIFHKLVDNLNLFHEMKCYVSPSFNYSDPNSNMTFRFLDVDNDKNDGFSV